MSQLSQVQSVSLGFAHESDGEGYVVSLTDADATLATVRIPADLVERIVLESVPLQIELSANGHIVAYVDRSAAPDLVARPLSALVADALAVVSPEDDAADLATLEAMLADALTAVRAARNQLG